LPYPKKESDTNSMPDPELNPLVNPVLAANMGRWAEVYFTSPPERREQAVAELIRELENDSLPTAASDQANNNKSVTAPETAEAAESSSYAVELLRSCSACGHKNSAEQKFCGMCGAPVQVSPESHAPHLKETAPVSGARWSEPQHSPKSGSGQYATEPGVSSSGAFGSYDAEGDSMWLPAEGDLPSFAIEPEPVPYRYRLYVGVTLAILLSLLIYMSWRGTKAISSNSSPQSVPSKVMPPAPVASVPAAPAPVQQPRATPSGPSGGDAQASPVASENPPEATPQKEQGAEAQPASSVVTGAASSTPIASEHSGTEDLTTAEYYLSGAHGRTRDSKEAALWLWKAVGKGNPTATLVLSDLYLRGDGVPKSCDQARLLLDAAARKGARAAGERLRNLQAFGCQ